MSKNKLSILKLLGDEGYYVLDASGEVIEYFDTEKECEKFINRHNMSLKKNTNINVEENKQ